MLFVMFKSEHVFKVVFKVGAVFKVVSLESSYVSSLVFHFRLLFKHLLYISVWFIYFLTSVPQELHLEF